MRDFASACLVIHQKKRHLQKANCLICNQQVVGSRPTAGSLSQRDLGKKVAQIQPSLGQIWAKF